jgi:proteasome accessory factor B
VRALDELEALYQQQVATIRVSSDSDAWSALSKRRGTDILGQNLMVHFTDADIFAEELCSYGEDVVVLEPLSVVTAVTRHLKTLVSSHA